MQNIELYIEEDIMEESLEEFEDHIKTYSTTITFRNENDEWIGDLIVYFHVRGYGIEGFEGGIDTYYHVPAFCDPSGEKEFLEDHEALLFIFSNFGEQVYNFVENVLDILDDHYENGTPLTLFGCE
jgi:hypothetical protein